MDSIGKTAAHKKPPSFRLAPKLAGFDECRVMFYAKHLRFATWRRFIFYFSTKMMGIALISYGSPPHRCSFFFLIFFGKALERLWRWVRWWFFPYIYILCHDFSYFQIHQNYPGPWNQQLFAPENWWVVSDANRLSFFSQISVGKFLTHSSWQSKVPPPQTSSPPAPRNSRP